MFSGCVCPNFKIGRRILSKLLGKMIGKRGEMAPQPASANLITSAAPALSDDQSGRAKRYFISMMIRTICFIATVLLPSPWRWVTLMGALLLPYISVIVANAGRETVKIPQNLTGSALPLPGAKKVKE
jgi:hypothetical protein